MIITIDGPVATGKSSIAKNLAKSIGFIFFDTGAMYRALTYAVLKHGISLENKKELKTFLDNFDFDIKIRLGERRYFVEGEDVTLEIRREKVTKHVSEVAANPMVREKLVGIQRKLSKGVNAVFEGRDMSTVVFPDAELKIFLTGDPKVRAERRYNELIEKFPDMKETLTVEEVQKEIEARDEYDSNRPVSPLKQADDAKVIDTTDLAIDEIVYKILEYRDSEKSKFLT